MTEFKEPKWRIVIDKDGKPQCVRVRQKEHTAPHLRQLQRVDFLVVMKISEWRGETKYWYYVENGSNETVAGPFKTNEEACDWINESKTIPQKARVNPWPRC
jgi:hypothetical protein